MVDTAPTKYAYLANIFLASIYLFYLFPLSLSVYFENICYLYGKHAYYSYSAPTYWPFCAVTNRWAASWFLNHRACQLLSDQISWWQMATAYRRHRYRALWSTVYRANFDWFRSAGAVLGWRCHLPIWAPWYLQRLFIFKPISADLRLSMLA